MKNTNQKHNEADMVSLLNNKQLQASLAGIRRGIERELVRTTNTGELSALDHPYELGSALTHPYITTDFAEAQLELVTPAMTNRSETFESLMSLHQFVANRLPEGETLWGASMPPHLPNDEQIQIAQFGSSNAGLLKQRYRQGLANRYGKRMQLISGIHYNFSLPQKFWSALHKQTKSDLPLDEFISERYFHMIRNVLRHGWIVPYLFGASPAVDSSYLQGKQHSLIPLDDQTYYLPWATSLRLSNLGYSSAEQSSYPISFNTKQQYLSDLYQALTRPSERYQNLNSDQQMNGSVLQLENELYGSVRPKIVHDQLRPLYAMCHYGVQYIELRSLDNNPYLPLGISEEQSQFLDLFLTYSALALSPELTEQERRIVIERQERVATQGRKPGLLLPTLEGEVSLQALGLEMMASLSDVARQFDAALNQYAESNTEHQQSIERETAKLLDGALTPSAQLLEQMTTQSLTHNELIHKLSEAQMVNHQSTDISLEALDNLTNLVTESHFKQHQMESQQEVSFSEFLQQNNHLQSNCEQQKAHV